MGDKGAVIKLPVLHIVPTKPVLFCVYHVAAIPHLPSIGHLGFSAEQLTVGFLSLSHSHCQTLVISHMD
jgi:hypothetical protein